MIELGFDKLSSILILAILGSVFITYCLIFLNYKKKNKYIKYIIYSLAIITGLLITMIGFLYKNFNENDLEIKDVIIGLSIILGGVLYGVFTIIIAYKTTHKYKGLHQLLLDELGRSSNNNSNDNLNDKSYKLSNEPLICSKKH